MLPRIYSAGGPTGEVHAVDPETGGFGAKLQELLYVPADELEQADKTRVALVSRDVAAATGSDTVLMCSVSLSSAMAVTALT